MLSYTPKLYDAIIAAMLCILCLVISGKASRSIASAFNYGAVMFGVLFLIVILLLIRESNIRRIDAMTSFAEKIVGLDDEGRAMMAFEFPYLRYHMKRGEVREYFEDTNVPMEMFKEFLRTSDQKYISPRRDWCTSKKPEWAWIEIKEDLEARGLIVSDSAAGSHSWKWRGHAYEHIKAYWGAGLKLRDMSDELVMHSPGYMPPDVVEAAMEGD